MVEAKEKDGDDSNQMVFSVKRKANELKFNRKKSTLANSNQKETKQKTDSFQASKPCFYNVRNLLNL